MTYAWTYESDDLATIIIDFLSTAGVQAVAFAGLIVLVIIFAYLKKKGNSLF